jgi:ATP-dependent DNA ligase
MSEPVEGNPAGLRRPVEVALAKAVRVLPATNVLPGQLCVEPKWAGYRILIFRNRDQASLWSRQRKDLTRYLPELEIAAAEMIPPGCVVDGEAVAGSGHGLNFEALQLRLSAGRERSKEAGPRASRQFRRLRHS